MATIRFNNLAEVQTFLLGLQSQTKASETTPEPRPEPKVQSNSSSSAPGSAFRPKEFEAEANNILEALGGYPVDSRAKFGCVGYSISERHARPSSKLRLGRRPTEFLRGPAFLHSHLLTAGTVHLEDSDLDGAPAVEVSSAQPGEGQSSRSLKAVVRIFSDDLTGSERREALKESKTCRAFYGGRLPLPTAPWPSYLEAENHEVLSALCRDALADSGLGDKGLEEYGMELMGIREVDIHDGTATRKVPVLDVKHQAGDNNAGPLAILATAIAKQINLQFGTDYANSFIPPVMLRGTFPDTTPAWIYKVDAIFDSMFAMMGVDRNKGIELFKNMLRAHGVSGIDIEREARTSQKSHLIEKGAEPAWKFEISKSEGFPTEIMQSVFAIAADFLLKRGARRHAEYAQHIAGYFRTQSVKMCGVVGELPLLERFASLSDGKVYLKEAGLSREQFIALKSWVASQFGFELPYAHVSEAILALINFPLGEKDDETITAALDLHAKLGTLSNYSAEMFKILWKRYGKKFRDSPHALRINAHLKYDAMPYIVFQKLFEPDSTAIKTKSYSSAPNMLSLCSLADIRVHEGVGELGYNGREDSVMTVDLPGAGDAPLALEGGAGILKQWVSTHGDEAVREAFKSKRVKIVSHNVADSTKLKALTGVAPKRRLNTTLQKQYEARLIGERQAIQAAEIVRDKWNSKIGDHPIVVAGAGLIGGALVESLLKLGIAPDKILVVDTDDSVRRKFSKMGCLIHSRIEADSKAPAGFERAVVFHATTGANFNLNNVFQYAKKSIFISMVTGGDGMDIQTRSLAKQIPRLARHVSTFAKSNSPGVWNVGYSRRLSSHQYVDKDYHLDGREVCVIAEGMPPNLLDEQWAERFELTPMLVIMSLLEAMVGDDPDGPTVPHELDELAMELFKAFDGQKTHRFKGYSDEDWRALLGDFKR